MSSRFTSTGVAEGPQGSRREPVSPALPDRPQLELLYDAEAARKNEQDVRRTVFRKAVMAFGGADALRLALGRPEHYLSHISEALSGQKPIQEGWRAPLLKDPRAAVILLEHDSQVAGAEPPVFTREVDDAEVARAAVEVLAESGQLRETFRAQIAKRLGVRPDQVKL